MKNIYVRTPESISVKSIEEKEFTLSSSQYMDLVMPNKNFRFVRDFLSRPLKRCDLGVEVGSINYIGQSPFYFLRTKALQAYSFLPEITSETALPVMPKVFVKQNLKEGDLIISKDSNIGEIAILDKDYPNVMLSGAIYKLPVTDNKLYLLAFIKHEIFREQLEFMVPKGATIRHAKTMFLDCKIPFPTKNAAKTIEYVEVLTQAIINKEKLIKEKHQKILKIIEEELTNNQKNENFIFELPTLNEIEKIGRLDTPRYSRRYKEFEFKIKNYEFGSFKLYEYGYTIKRGQNLQVSNIGQSHYSDKFIKGFYELVVSSNFSEYSTIEKHTYLGNPRELSTINQGDIIFSARGHLGRVIVFPEKIENTITNIDSVVISNENVAITRSIFIAMFLNMLRWNKHLYDIAITGSGANSLTQYQFDDINFPKFPDDKIEEISNLYYNPKVNYDTKGWTLTTFLKKDSEFNSQAGIYELDKTAKLLKAKLDLAIDGIVNDKPVKIDFA